MREKRVTHTFSIVDSNGRTIFTIDAHCDGKRFIVRADEKLTTFLDLQHQVSKSVKR
jgi:hypothetical protein